MNFYEILLKLFDLNHRKFKFNFKFKKKKAQGRPHYYKKTQFSFGKYFKNNQKSFNISKLKITIYKKICF